MSLTKNGNREISVAVFAVIILSTVPLKRFFENFDFSVRKFSG